MRFAGRWQHWQLVLLLGQNRLDDAVHQQVGVTPGRASRPLLPGLSFLGRHRIPGCAVDRLTPGGAEVMYPIAEDNRQPTVRDGYWRSLTALIGSSTGEIEDLPQCFEQLVLSLSELFALTYLLLVANLIIPLLW